MPVVINEVSVESAPPPQPAPATARPAGSSPAQIANAAERHWRRVADLQERVRAD